MDRNNALPSTLRLAHLEQAPLEVDVIPVESEQFAASQPGVGEEGEHEEITLALAREVALPDVGLVDGGEEPAEFTVVEYVRERLALLRRTQHKSRVAVEVLVLEAEA